MITDRMPTLFSDDIESLASTTVKGTTHYCQIEVGLAGIATRGIHTGYTHMSWLRCANRKKKGSMEEKSEK